MQRRHFLSFSAFAAAASVTGCDSGKVTEPIVASVESAASGVEEAVEETSTENLERYRVALRGYEIVSGMIGPRVFFLPYPGMRILSVVIVVSTVSAKLAIKYIDTELIQRQFEEELTDEERSLVESDGYVQFETESGVSETVMLGPSEYT